MAVSEQTPYIEYTANGSVRNFALGFDCENQDHLIVLVDEIEPVVGTWSLISGAVVFGVAPVGGKKITIQRNTPFRRDEDFQSYDNSFRPPGVNKGFDRVWYKIQELGVRDWLLDLKIQKFRDEVNLTALENTLKQSRDIRDATSLLADEVQANTTQSATLLTNTTAKANAAATSATNANTAKTQAQQAVTDANSIKTDMYTALYSFQNGATKAYPTLAAATTDIANIALDTKVTVLSATDGGDYYKATAGATILTKSPYDPLAQAKVYVDGKIIPIVPLYNPINNVEGKFVNVSSGNISAFTDYFLNIFPVVAGEKYAVYTPINHFDFTIATKADNSTGIGATQGTVSFVATSNPNVRTFIAPPLAKFAFANVKIGTRFDFRESFKVNRGGEIVDHSEIYTIDGAEIVDKSSRARLDTIENSGVSVVDNVARSDISVLGAIIDDGFSVLNGKKWVAVGDSITQKNFRANNNYHDFIKGRVSNLTVVNMGLSGTGYYSRYDVASKITAVDPDFITVFLGTNDYSYAGKPLGSFLDSTTDTVSGCINVCLRDILTSFYKSKIGVFTPLPRINLWGESTSQNSNGYTFPQLCDLIIRYCEHYSIPCLDLYRNSNLSPWISASNSLYFTAPNSSTPDGLHPNDAGHEKISNIIQDFLESL